MSVHLTGEAVRRVVGRWLERQGRCCACGRRVDGGTHAFGFWFCSRHFNADTIGRWSD